MSATGSFSSRHLGDFKVSEQSAGLISSPHSDGSGALTVSAAPALTSASAPRLPCGRRHLLGRRAGARGGVTGLQRRQKVDAGTSIGSGKAGEIAELAQREGANVVIFDNDLSPSQIGSLEKVINHAVGNNQELGRAHVRTPDTS